MMWDSIWRAMPRLLVTFYGVNSFNTRENDMRSAQKTATVALMAGAGLALSACSISGHGPLMTTGDLTGETSTEARSLDGFTGVEVTGDADVELSEGEEFSVKVTADTGLQDHIDTAVVGTTLLVEQNYSIIGSSPHVLVQVTVPELSSVELSGSSAAVISDVDGGPFTLDVSGSADVVMDATAKDMSISVSGSGDITARGTVAALFIDVSGSGEISGKDLTAADARVDVSGSGTISLRARESLDVAVSGSGDVFYWGDPVITEHITGSGDVSTA